MFGQIYNHRAFRNLTVAFGTLFNEIILLRYDENGNETSRFKVPIIYAPKQKYLVRTTEDPKLDKQVGIVYPRMSFQYVGLQRHKDLQLQRTRENYYPKDDNTETMVLNPTVWDVKTELYLVGKNAEDVFQIVEKILPVFGPQYSMTVKVVDALGIKDDLAVTLDGAPFQDKWDGPIDQQREIIWTFQFTISNFKLYGNASDSSLIREVRTDMYVMDKDIETASLDLEPREVRILTVPDPIDATPADFGFSTSIEEFNDGKRYNVVTGVDEPVEE